METAPGREELIRERAHNIWVEEGKPEGREKEHWERAAREIDIEAPASGEDGYASRAKETERRQ